MKKFKFNLNDALQDIVTGYRGTCIQRTDYLTGCNRYTLQTNRKDEKGDLCRAVTFDENQLKLFKTNVSKMKVEDRDFKFDTGDHVKDIITGVDGIVVARSDYITSVPKYALLPEKLVNGQPVDWQCFDEGSLTTIKSHKINLETTKPVKKSERRERTGGPSPVMDRNSLGTKAKTL